MRKAPLHLRCVVRGCHRYRRTANEICNVHWSRMTPDQRQMVRRQERNKVLA